jgi:hypothetical protein
MNRILAVLTSSLAFAACGGAASASGGDWLRAEIVSARSGAVIEVPAGDYDLKDLKITRSLTLRGPADGGAVFRSAETTEKGILVPLAGVDLTIENITFAGAKSWDRNGAGVRHEGRNLTIVNCRFVGNEDGVLSTGDPKGVVTISKSQFVDSGFGDGQSHAIYVFEAARLEVIDSKFIGTRIGHHVKSLADVTVVRGNLLDDAYGRSSYAVDVSKGGDVTVANNTIVQSADADNYTIVNYDLSRGGEARKIVITGNRIVNHVDGGVLLRNDTKLAPVLSGNEIENKGKRPMSLVTPGSPKPAAQ